MIGLGAGSMIVGAMPVASVFDPASLALSGWWRANYTNPGPWNGVASAGASSGRDLSEATNPPATGTAQNGLTPADFDGSNDELSIATGVSSFFSASAWTIVVLFRADSTVAATGDLYECESFLADDGASATIGMGITDSGVQVWHYGGGAWPGLTIAAGTGAYHLAQAKYDGTNIKMRIDSGSYSSQAASNASLSSNLRVGMSWNGSKFYDGRLTEIMLAQSALSDADLDNIKSYLNARYALAL